MPITDRLLRLQKKITTATTVGRLGTEQFAACGNLAMGDLAIEVATGLKVLIYSE
jgi:hypothetical protein